jgi:hypothetical protein
MRLSFGFVRLRQVSEPKVTHSYILPSLTSLNLGWRGRAQPSLCISLLILAMAGFSKSDEFLLD